MRPGASQKHETPPLLAGLFQKNKDWIVMARRPFDSFFSLNHPGYQYIRGLPQCSERYMGAECRYFKAGRTEVAVTSRWSARNSWGFRSSPHDPRQQTNTPQAQAREPARR